MKQNFKETLNLKCDVLIVGGGGTGLSAAITARMKDLNVFVASKSKVGFANNTYISAGAFSSTGWGASQDGPRLHLKDTILSGRFINDIKLAEIVARQSHDQVSFLEKCGVDFSKKNQQIRVGLAPGHSFPRNVWGKTSHGSDFMLPLVKCATDTGVKFLDHTVINRLFHKNGRITGAMGFDTSGRILRITAGSVVLATGGFARIYQNNNNAPGICGDGQALAITAGVGLRDMEFVQFYPTYGTLYEVTVVRGGARLVNSGGEDILNKHGMTDLTAITRDKLSRAVFAEINDGLGIDGGVFLDISTIPENVLGRIRGFLPQDAFDRDKKIIVKPTAHFCMGGIIINEKTMTTIEGLFGAGEVCGGVHGANRLGGNALCEVFSMGRMAGDQASDYAMRNRYQGEELSGFEEEKRKLTTAFSSKKGDFKAIRARLKQIMWKKAGIMRNAAGLEAAIAEIDQIKEQSQCTGVNNFRQLMKLVELENMALVAGIVCRCALCRTESRGAHYRSDFPEENNDQWLCNLVVTKKNSGFNIAMDSIDRGAISHLQSQDGGV